ncbi:acyl-CoA thioesterase [Xanthobacter dioxanivorans]|uniref:Acyl-CoA thioesterase n=1 Tax=Xanthobacter dioxanivorans TaxID=2528964 RepID=A0A974PKN2_9HYPH|nr:acyl-CoA thioesterase [Xanthobacter dioxanivorans]
MLAGIVRAAQPAPRPAGRPAVSERAAPHRRADYRHFRKITTRWMDNDVYRHVNNVVYYSFFDTAVGHYLIEAGALDIETSPVIGLVAETRCQYFSSLSFPSLVHAGLRVGRLGTSSARYEIGLFRDDDDLACAQGHFIHVYVDRATNRPVPLPEKLRAVLSVLLVAPRDGAL